MPSGINHPCYGKSSNNQYTNKDWDSVPFEDLSYDQRRKRLFKEAENACSQCGFDKKRENGGLILEVDHIDGNSDNNIKENLRVLCPNCHALTPTFRNWGRKSGEKSSKRLRKGNKQYNQYIDLLKNEKIESIERMKNNILSLNIDYTRRGWVKEVAISTNMLSQKVRWFISENMPGFLEERKANIRVTNKARQV